MHEEGRGSGRRERGSELAADVTRFSDSGDDNAATTVEDQVDRGYERRADARLQCGDRLCFGGQHIEGERQRARRVDGKPHRPILWVVSCVHRASIVYPSQSIVRAALRLAEHGA